MLDGSYYKLINNQMMTYSIYPSIAHATKPVLDFARKMTTFNKTWQQAIVKHFGHNNDINMDRIVASFHDPDDECILATVIYPGQKVFYLDSGKYTHGDNENCFSWSHAFESNHLYKLKKTADAEYYSDIIFLEHSGNYNNNRNLVLGWFDYLENAEGKEVGSLGIFWKTEMLGALIDPVIDDVVTDDKHH